MVFAQTTKGQVYFEGLYGDATSGQGISKGGTLSLQDGFLSWAYSHGNFKPYLFRVDEEGSPTHELFMTHPDTINRLSHNIVAVSDCSFVGLVSVRVLTQPVNVRGDFGLVKFSINGEVIWEHIYGRPDRYEIPQRMVQTSDGGFAMVGQAIIGTESSEHGNVYLIRTDANGEHLWEQTYGGSQYDAGLDLVQTPDGGFLLLGWTYSYGAGQRDFYLIKTDISGNQQWQSTYGGGGEDIGEGIIALSDGNYLLYGASEIGGYSGVLHKVTPTGDVIWSYDYAYSDQPLNAFFKAIELPCGSIAATGGTDVQGEGNAGWLVKTDSEGNELWQRKYNKNEHTDLFYSVLATDDGGFLLSGVARNTETNSPDAWLLKVDSIGCAFPNCVTGIAEQERTVMMDAWPNPCTDILNVEMADAATPMELQVLDISGREVLRHTQHEARGTLDVGHWKSGVYVLRGMDGKGRSFNVKIMKR